MCEGFATQILRDPSCPLGSGPITRPVLVLGAQPHFALTIARSLHRRGIPVTIATSSLKGPRLSSRAIRRFVRLPSHQHRPDEFIAALSALIRSEKFDMLIPSSDSALIALTQHYEYLSTLLHVACPPPHIVKRVVEKPLTFDIAKRCGVNIPITYLVSNSAELESLRTTLRFPVIAKPRSKMDIGTHTFKVRYFQTFEGLKAAFLADADFGLGNVLQEYCPGEGVAIGTLIHKGEPIAMFQDRRLKEMQGMSVMTSSEELDPVLRQWSLTLLRDVGWEGIAMVEYRHNRCDGTAALLEVNGRYWGSLALAVHAGIDFPFYEWQLAHGEKPQVPSRYHVGMRARWIAGDILRLHSLFKDPISVGFPRPSRWKELVRFLTDFKPRTRAVLWSIGDPVPFLLDVGHTLKRLAAEDAKVIIKRLLPRRMANLLRTYKRYATMVGSRAGAGHKVGVSLNPGDRGGTNS